MSIITISRGSYSRGKEVAEKLSQAWVMSASPGRSFLRLQKNSTSRN